jgi:ribosomal-protein-alanine N-acetyltransferase
MTARWAASACGSATSERAGRPPDTWSPPGERGRGFATDALRSLIDFAWTLPDLHRVELYIEEWNIGSLRVAAGAGFTHEGVLRSHQEIGGTRRDMLLFAAVRGER